MMPNPRLLRAVRDKKGMALVEFALIAPTFLLLLMGVFDIGYGMYIKAILEGAVESAGRISSLENTTTTAIDDKVRAQVTALNRSGNLQFTRIYYQNYVDVDLPEDFTDANANSNWDPGECFVDRNGNNTWDADVGLPGRGGAQDVVLYSATLEYRRLFPLWSMLGQSETKAITGTTYLRNQPFSAQAARVGVRIC
jgi:Flp pilus assembly protein TadG